MTNSQKRVSLLILTLAVITATFSLIPDIGREIFAAIGCWQLGTWMSNIAEKYFPDTEKG